MPRRTKNELLAEYRRLGALWDAWRDYKLSRTPQEAASDHRSTRSSEELLSLVAPSGPTLSHLLEGTRQAVLDTSEQLQEWIEDGYAEGREFLDFYRARTGRDWWEDAGDPARMTRTILKRGRIRNETEWYLLQNIVTNVDQTDFSPEEMERLSAMQQTFEDSRAAR